MTAPLNPGTVLVRAPTATGFLDFSTLGVGYTGGVFVASNAHHIYALDDATTTPWLFARMPDGVTVVNFVSHGNRFITASKKSVFMFFECPGHRFVDQAFSANPYAPLRFYPRCGNTFHVADLPPGALVDMVIDRDQTLWMRYTQRQSGGGIDVGAVDAHRDLWGGGSPTRLFPPGATTNLFLGGDGAAYVTLANGGVARLQTAPSHTLALGAVSYTMIAPHGITEPITSRDLRLPLVVSGVGRDGSLWGYSPDSVYHQHPDGHVVRLRFFPATISSNGWRPSSELRVGLDGAAWFKTSNGMFHIDSNDSVTKLDVPWEIDDWVLSPDGTIWFASRARSYIVHLSARPHRRDDAADRATDLRIWPLPEDHAGVRDVVESRDGQVFFRDGHDPDAIGVLRDRAVGVSYGPGYVPQPAAAVVGQWRLSESVASDGNDGVWALSRDLLDPIPQFRHVAGNLNKLESIVEPLDVLRSGADGNVYAHALDGAIYEVLPSGKLSVVARDVGDRFAVARDGTLWLVRDGDLWSVTNRQSFKRWSLSAPASPVRFIAARQGGGVWIAASSALCLFRDKTQKCLVVDPQLPIGPLYPQGNGLWFAWGEHLLAYFNANW